jgi:spoIIIJ-associated protein
MDIANFIKNLFSIGGFDSVEVSVDKNLKKISIVVDDELFRSQIPNILEPTEYLINLVLKKNKEAPYVIDLNYYRKERERLIIELAKASAKKAKINKEDVHLPPMNSYERRLVHMEIASNPDLKTESVGFGKDRHIIIKVIKENETA